MARARRSKARQAVRSKEELLKELRENSEWTKNMSFIKGQFWPALCAASESVEDATMLISGFNTQIMQEFLARMKSVKLSELGLKDKLNKESTLYLRHLALVELFADMDVFTAKTLIEGMRNEIAQFQQDEMRQRPLSSLKTAWLDD